ncbi:hypothetical protein GCM10010174_10290 [Kutzneria viridogrisea]|uniref:Phage-associated protein n=1 Tax=Kutzneria viridogrisea TaxID=47990 RepID=A0ABR6BIC9_9PSEU|nr:putative phage-associated protein [Kutzneria viridogrisea]
MARVEDVMAAVRARTGPEPLAKLRTLLYYAQAWHLATHRRPLFGAAIEARREGPVVPEAGDRQGDPAALTEQEQEVVRVVVARYGSFSPAELSAMAREEQPWRATGAGEPLSHEVMARYFGRQVSEHNTAIEEARAGARLEGVEVTAGCVDSMREVAEGRLSTEDAIERRVRALLSR